MTPVVASDAAETLADLVERLGGVPLWRIRLQPPPGTATEEDVLIAEQRYDRLFELVDGTLVEKGMGFTESLLAVYLIVVLDGFVRPRNLGLVTAPDGTIRLAPRLVRIPDVAFTSWDRMPERRRPTAPIPHLAPDLAVEVLSASNTPGEMARKMHDYFGAGVRLAWIIDPVGRTVRVYTAADQFTILHDADTLDGGAVLPEFTLPLRELFAELDRQGGPEPGGP
jgi:Uma2 family endonuclease